MYEACWDGLEVTRPVSNGLEMDEACWQWFGSGPDLLGMLCKWTRLVGDGLEVDEACWSGMEVDEAC